MLQFGLFCRSGVAYCIISVAGSCFANDGSLAVGLHRNLASGRVSADYRSVDQEAASPGISTGTGGVAPWQAPSPKAVPLGVSNVDGVGIRNSVPGLRSNRNGITEVPAVQDVFTQEARHREGGASVEAVLAERRQMSRPVVLNAKSAALSSVNSETASALLVGHDYQWTTNGTPISVYPAGVELNDTSFRQQQPFRPASAQPPVQTIHPGGHSVGPLPQQSHFIVASQMDISALSQRHDVQTATRQQITQTLPPPSVPEIPQILHGTPDGSGGPGQQQDSLLANGDKLSWWEADLITSVLRGRPPLPMTLERTLGLALSEAPELKVLQSDWYINQLEVTRRDAAFDWTTFVSSVWNRDSTPVGSRLDGATNRLRSRTASSRGGVRRQARDGGEFEMSQNFGINSSNSQFISPDNQGNSRLTLRYERPLLRGGGEEYNTSIVRLAEIEKDTAFDRFRIGVQDHLLETATAYWVLVLRRGRFVQALSSWNRSVEIANEMAARVNVDVTPTMLDRTRSEVSTRLANAIRAEHEVLAAQDSLLRLIYGSRFTDFTDYEVVTQTLPMKEAQPMAPESQIQVALSSRPEIHQSIRNIKAAAVRFQVAENEILPVLNLVLTGYVAGLRGNNDIGGSFLNQFTQGEPGAGIGLNYEIPYRNRAALAAAEQGKVAIKRMQSQLETAIAGVTEDVRAQVIKRNMNGAVLQQQLESLARSKRILKYTQIRREELADGTRVADLYLENLLQMQSRLENAEFTYLQSQVRFAIADNALLRAVAALDTLAEGTAGACESGVVGTDQAVRIHGVSEVSIDQTRAIQTEISSTADNADGTGVTPASHRHSR